MPKKLGCQNGIFTEWYEQEKDGAICRKVGGNKKKAPSQVFQDPYENKTTPLHRYGGSRAVPIP
ncbi:MAG: hypothetical protein ABSB71_01975 [Candidatus Bathyarchaeia archaeon]